MNILYHHRTQGKTVEGVHIREVVKALRAQGHSVYLVSPPGIDPFLDTGAEKPAGKITYISGFLAWLSSHVPQFAFEIMELGYSLIAYIKIQRVLGKGKIDFIYERYAFFNMAGAWASERNNVPLVLEVNEVSGIERQRGQYFVGLTKMAERYIFKRASAIIAVSGFLKERITEMDIEQSKVHVLANSVNTGDFDPDISGESVRDSLNLHGKTVLGFMGSFCVWDKLEFLIEVFSDISKQNPEMLLILVGDGFNRDKLEEDVRNKGLSEKILFTGRVLRAKVPEYIAVMDIAVIPHSNPFGSPVVLFEFMAMAKPVVAPELGPISEVIVSRDNGLLFEPENASAMKQQILELAEHSSSRKRIGDRAREAILSGHQWSHNAERIIKLYEEFK
jgi:glycosyltransferase involved in cell wall biosynthesis